MRAFAHLHHPRVAKNDATSTHLVVTVEAGEVTESLRPRLCIIPVVDRSGSMGREHKLAIVTAALRHLSSHLVADDQVGLVSFDDTVCTHLRPRPADARGMAAFHGVLSELAPRNMTDLSGGLAAGLAAAHQVAASAERGTIVRVLVLTDGQANAGLTSPDGLLAQVADLPGSVSVSFLGVGTDCDHDLLGRLAEAGGGSYGFIETAERAADALGAEIGGLLHTAVAGLEVELRAREKYVRFGEPLASRTETHEATTTVRLGVLGDGARRHVVVPVTTIAPGRAHARPVTIADVLVRGIVDDAPVEIKLLPKVHFGEAGGADHELDETVELAVLADAQARAEEAARAGRYEDSVTLLGAVTTTTGSAKALQSWLAQNYADQHAYGASAVERRSSIAAFSNTAGGLVGSSAGFDAMASRTLGSYVTDAQRHAANETRAAVSRALGLSPADRAQGSWALEQHLLDDAISVSLPPVEGGSSDISGHASHWQADSSTIFAPSCTAGGGPKAQRAAGAVAATAAPAPGGNVCGTLCTGADEAVAGAKGDASGPSSQDSTSAEPQPQAPGRRAAGKAVAR